MFIPHHFLERTCRERYCPILFNRTKLCLDYDHDYVHEEFLEDR